MMKKLNVLTHIALGLVMTLGTTASQADSVLSKKDAKELAQYREAERIGKEHLIKFDTLDFDVYSNQKWDRLKESHAANIRVHYPDGSTTVGIPDHIVELKKMFVFAPNTKIKTHPIRIASGEWTSVVGEIEGNFSQPMPIGNGKTIPPTGKPFKFKMVTVGHWKNGTMDEEYLFWDNQAFMKQIGLEK